MKQIAKLVVKSLFVIVLFTVGSVAVSTTGAKTVSEANACTYNQVYEYLLSRGYQVITLEPKAGTKYDWISHTVLNQVHYWTTIHCNATSVIGHEDDPM